jgi:hypothetical protein
MAGTIVADTIQDGAGNSTSMDNAIYGSAKAWVNFNGNGSTTIRASYNISSVTYTSTGIYVVNFTNAFTDTNYATVCSSGANRNGTSTTGWFGPDITSSPSYTSKTTSSIQVCTLSGANGNLNTIDFNIVCFR